MCRFLPRGTEMPHAAGNRKVKTIIERFRKDPESEVQKSHFMKGFTALQVRRPARVGLLDREGASLS
eukprot:SAG11_NODE_33218_length_278_cov_1.156425_1_plen_66_part_01